MRSQMAILLLMFRLLGYTQFKPRKAFQIKDWVVSPEIETALRLPIKRKWGLGIAILSVFSLSLNNNCGYFNKHSRRTPSLFNGQWLFSKRTLCGFPYPKIRQEFLLKFKTSLISTAAKASVPSTACGDLYTKPVLRLNKYWNST